jgi:hypothetical protein
MYCDFEERQQCASQPPQLRHKIFTDFCVLIKMDYRKLAELGDPERGVFE